MTKLCIDYYEHTFAFDTYLDERAKKDTKFVNPLTDVADEKEGGKHRDRNEDSEFSMSGEDDEDMSQTVEDQATYQLQRSIAEELYKRTRDEIEK